MTSTDALRVTRRRQPSAESMLITLVAWLQLCAERRSQRLDLLELSDNLLKDIGVSRADAVAEGTKPSWRR